jgi:hypothetical protein
MKQVKVHWPGWFYGPNGAAAIFQSRDEVPAGWEDHPSKVAHEAPKAEKIEVKAAEPAPHAPKPRGRPRKS